MPPTRSSTRQVPSSSQPAPTRASSRRVVSSSQPTARTTHSSSNNAGSRSSSNNNNSSSNSNNRPTQHSASQPTPKVTQQPAYTAVVVPGPDDSDFLDSEIDFLESEQDGLDEEGNNQVYANAKIPSGMTSSESQGHPMPVRPLVRIAPRIYFAVFPHPAPDMGELSSGNGSRSVVLPAADAHDLEEQGRRRKDVLQDGSVPLHQPKLKHWEWLIVDNDLPYLSFFDDWGPLNIGMFWRFCTHVHQWLIDPEYAHKNLVVYTSTDPHRKANAALLMSLWALVIEKVEPADAFFPFSTWEFEPFRDAGYGRADFNLSIQDVLYGLHRGLACGLLDLSQFDIDEYEHYEQVQNGDWNWITPNFIAFASPNDKDYVAQLRANAQAQQAGGTAAVSLVNRMKKPMSKLMGDTIKYFRKKNIKLVVRLNNPLYDKKVFEDAGINHVDMYFDDGSNPSTEILREFIKLADEVVKAGGVIAVHCKAGLGRTGVLIGAYLIWNHGFTANEVIGFMRLMRPGCVVGPQQHFMYTQFVEWVRWGEQARMEAEKAALEAENKRIEGELERSRREVEQIRRELALAQAQVQGGLQGAKADEASRMRLKRKSSADRDFEDVVENGTTVLDQDADLGPLTPRPRKIAQFRPVGAEGEGSSTDAALDAIMSGEHVEDVRLRMATIVKPPPVVGQPRKSPSPSRKRSAQLQAPPTESRLGSMRAGFGRALAAGILGTAGAIVGEKDGNVASGSGSGSDSANADGGETPTHSPALDKKGKRSNAVPVRTSSLLRKNGGTSEAGEVDGQPPMGTERRERSGSLVSYEVGAENTNVPAARKQNGKPGASSSSSSVQPLMQSIHAGNVQVDHNDTIRAARSILTQDGGKLTLTLSPKESVIGSGYVRTGGMASPSLKSIGSSLPAAGSTTPKAPPPLPHPSTVLARLNQNGAHVSRSQPSIMSALETIVGSPVRASSSVLTPATSHDVDDVFSSPPPPTARATSGSTTNGASKIASAPQVAPVFRASPEVRDRFGLKDSRLPTRPRDPREREQRDPRDPRDRPASGGACAQQATSTSVLPKAERAGSTATATGAAVPAASSRTRRARQR
ncbi:hypothetical protein A4X09_0g1303 [Tilletia walkeri]|uniref:protein-tyrosine-phosphatase n=1 Tax=Tilletia walkeri TaxID=117179 RepID=A0A8X7T7L8_9BASI|nr:hypothetical protein A4X09_0g1303 [Tilletia walkeri]